MVAEQCSKIMKENEDLKNRLQERNYHPSPGSEGWEKVKKEEDEEKLGELKQLMKMQMELQANYFKAQEEKVAGATEDVRTTVSLPKLEMPGEDAAIKCSEWLTRMCEARI